MDTYRTETSELFHLVLPHPTHPEHIHEVNQNFEHLSREMAGVSDIVGRTQQEGGPGLQRWKRNIGQLV